ncbi:MAG: hypothetical protein MRY79_05125 [Alphaproteobacteria bacterium]|nr:hypothetical protein [Alphaproteobacteria bacterium]
MSKSNFPITEKRQKILDKALAQLRKSRAMMDPKIINKIRRLIAGSPALMKQLGVDETLQAEEKVKKQPEVPKAPKVQKTKKPDSEPVDQAKMMDVMAKFMDMKPESKEQVKSVIKKTRGE